MGCRILAGKLVNEYGREAACLYDSVTDTAFGPLFADAEEAESFLVFTEDVGYPGHERKESSHE